MSVCTNEKGSISFLDSERERLNSIVEKNQLDLQRGEVQKASQRMDQIVLYWYRKNQKKIGL